MDLKPIVGCVGCVGCVRRGVNEQLTELSNSLQSKQQTQEIGTLFLLTFIITIFSIKKFYKQEATEKVNSQKFTYSM